MVDLIDLKRRSVETFHLGFDFSSVDPERWLLNDELYVSRIVYFIPDPLGSDLVNSREQCLRERSLNRVIKIERVEHMNLEMSNLAKAFRGLVDSFEGPLTIHCFISPEGSVSFRSHTDPDDVLIVCVEGTKEMLLDNKIYRLEPGDALFIPKGVVHMALNSYSSVTLSVGYEQFLEDKRYGPEDYLPEGY